MHIQDRVRKRNTENALIYVTIGDGLSQTEVVGFRA